MPSLTDNSDRHVVIARRPEHYLSFPDICRTPGGRLVVAYREADRHVARRSKLLLKTSDDRGKSWSAPQILNARCGHCPRISLLSDGQLVVIDDASSSLYWSLDEGRSWTQSLFDRLQHGIPDRIIELDAERFLTTAHCHRGTFPHPVTRQPTSEQMTYLSEDRGTSWKPLSVLAYDRNLVLCEASITRLPDGRLLALLRENTRVFEPMYMCLSDDDGNTWSLPAPVPMIGHRPCVGMTRSGKILVTYRNVAPDAGTAAWLGDFEELDDFKVHGLSLGNEAVVTEEGLLIEHSGEGNSGTYYALRPLTDPQRVVALLEAEVQVERADRNACGIYLGTCWRIFPDCIRPEVEDAEAIPLTPGKPHRLRLEYAEGKCALLVDGEHRATVAAKADSAEARPVLFGNAVTRDGKIPGPDSLFADNGGRVLWKALRLQIEEPGYGRTYKWSWCPQDGLPDAYARTRVLELKNDRFASMGDFGYSGWIELDDGEFLCAHHHGGGAEPGYRYGATAYVVGTRFYETDFEV